MPQTTHTRRPKPTAQNEIELIYKIVNIKEIRFMLEDVKTCFFTLRYIVIVVGEQVINLRYLT